MDKIRIFIKKEHEEFKREVSEMASAFFGKNPWEIYTDESRQAPFEQENFENILQIDLGLEGLNLPEAHYEAAKAIRRQVYKVFSEYTGKELPWGIMTGIRPVKLYRKLWEANPDMVERRLKNEYFVKPEKIRILEKLFQVENQLFRETRPEELSVYIGIPFCPSKCAYCSFSSSPIGKDREHVTAYLEALYREIEATGTKYMDGQSIQSVYIGGGTPGILEASEIEELLKRVREFFPGSKEITFEGGRPEVLSLEKLEVARRSGATRISINPQTMDEEVLRAMNRKHGVKEIRDAFHAARAAGFEDINMDLILGLPGDTWSGFMQSLEDVIQLGPESITVHALSLKKASAFMESGLRHLEQEKPEISELIQERLMKAGYEPYYLYRQKSTFLNLENVGYAKKGFECSFNIHSMADKQNCLAFGADAVSKIILPDGIKRVHNPKFPKDYEERIEECILKKRAFF